MWPRNTWYWLYRTPHHQGGASDLPVYEFWTAYEPKGGYISRTPHHPLGYSVQMLQVGKREPAVYRVRDGLAYRTDYHECGSTERPVYHLHGMRVYRTAYHPLGLSKSAVYRMVLAQMPVWRALIVALDSSDTP